MELEKLENHINRKLASLEKGKDMEELTVKGRLSFGIDSREYGHLPAWDTLLKKKKQLRKMIWLNAVFVSMMAVAIVGDVGPKLEQNWLKGIAYFLFATGLIMFLNVIWSYYSLFFHFRQVEREIRKLIYQDILSEIKSENSST